MDDRMTDDRSPKKPKLSSNGQDNANVVMGSAPVPVPVPVSVTAPVPVPVPVPVRVPVPVMPSPAPSSHSTAPLTAPPTTTITSNSTNSTLAPVIASSVTAPTSSSTTSSSYNTTTSNPTTTTTTTTAARVPTANTTAPVPIPLGSSTSSTTAPVIVVRAPSTSTTASVNEPTTMRAPTIPSSAPVRSPTSTSTATVRAPMNTAPASGHIGGTRCTTGTTVALTSGTYAPSPASVSTTTTSTRSGTGPSLNSSARSHKNLSTSAIINISKVLPLKPGKSVEVKSTPVIVTSSTSSSSSVISSTSIAGANSTSVGPTSTTSSTTDISSSGGANGSNTATRITNANSSASSKASMNSFTGSTSSNIANVNRNGSSTAVAKQISGSSSKSTSNTSSSKKSSAGITANAPTGIIADAKASSTSSSKKSSAGITANAPTGIIADAKASSTSSSKKSSADITANAPTGIIADAKASNNTPKNEKEPETYEITYKLYTNDGEDDSLKALTTLKEIFSKQLPKMPKEYIVRLVFDLNHFSLAIQKNGEIVGGICYRPYFDQHFAEIAFCAISGTEQVRGFGTMLMNNTKKFVQKQGIEYFLTYADNYAIGYFQKQGFTKHIGLSKERWVGWIKEYDGGTLMECYIHPGVNYLRVPEMIQFQRNFLYSRILAESRAHVVYPGLNFGNSSDGSNMLLTIFEAPGVLEAGWNANNVSKGVTERDRNAIMAKTQTTLKNIVNKVCLHDAAWPFKEPVDRSQYPDYYEVIKNPIDLRMIVDRLHGQAREGTRRGESSSYYRTKHMLRADLLRMAENCKIYNNDKSSEYYQTAEKFEVYILNLFGRDEAKGKTSEAR